MSEKFRPNPDDLKLPKKVGENLKLDKPTSAEGLHLPETIGPNLNLRKSHLEKKKSEQGLTKEEHSELEKIYAEENK